MGFLREVKSTHGLIEIDLSKAYTKAFMQIKAIPVFTEFDVFRPYREGDAIENLSLYIVKGNIDDKLFFNKTTRIC